MSLAKRLTQFCERLRNSDLRVTRTRKHRRLLVIESLGQRQMFDGIGFVEASSVATYRDFDFQVSGRATGTTTQGTYKDAYSATLINTQGTVGFTSATQGSGSVTGSARVVGRDNFESYNYTRGISGSASLTNGTLTNIRSSSLPTGLSVTGTFNPLTWAVGARWTGTVDGARVVGSFAGSVSQTLPNTDFLASVQFDTAAADAIHNDNNSIGKVAEKVKAIVTIDVTGQHMKASSMGTVVTTARIYLDDPAAGGTELADPIPIHWNTGKIVVTLENFLNKTNKSGKLFVVFDQDNKVAEANETNNKQGFDIPYDIRAEGIGWLDNGSVLGSYRVDVAGLNNSSLGGTAANLFYANAQGEILSTLYSTSHSNLSTPTFTSGNFGAFSLPLNSRPAGATQILLIVDRIIPPNKEINEANNAISLKLTELTSKGLVVNANGSSRLTLNVSAAPLAFATTAQLHWASGTPGNYNLLKQAAQVNLAKGKIGDLVYNFAANGLASRPVGATSLVVVIDPAVVDKPIGRIIEPNENNTFALNTAPKNLVLSKSTINENARTGTLVGQLSATHTDTADGLTYRLVTGSGSTDNSKFAVSTTGQLTSRVLFDFETKSSYSIRVQVQDRLGFSVQKAFTMSVNDVNEQPSQLILSNQTVSENLPAAALVGTLSALDPDANSTFTYSLVPIAGSTDHAQFRVVGNRLQTAGLLDFETKPSYMVRIRVTDQLGLSFVKDFSISVSNVAE